jgi:hypothetical protein
MAPRERPKANAFARPRSDKLDTGSRRLQALHNFGKQRRVDGRPAGGIVTKEQRVLDGEQPAGLVERGQGAGRANVDAARRYDHI